ncbi:hypothetical protein M2T79_09485 [Elizabethkingia miricola]|uniref:hypothetical protein n=1 Tax=Elizabethkingia miricola TaxID=172045 RepID=UPI0020187856|nr:hypothetical protein [Elizabethkingia miricola]MCL1656829.1 hypothetical protein [Elizabethkingia miricola]
MQNPNIDNLNKLSRIIVRNPLGFVASVFFMMFWITYFINIRKNNDAEQYWKELYLKEKSDKDRLKDELLIKAGIIEEQQAVIKEVDSTIRKSTPSATILLKQNKR